MTADKKRELYDKAREHPVQDAWRIQQVITDFEPHGRRKRGDTEMREMILKATCLAALVVMALFITACDSENLPIWVSLLGMLIPAGYIFAVCYANHWGY